MPELRITPSDALLGVGEQFGCSVAISRDASTVAVGEINHFLEGGANPGAVYLYSGGDYGTEQLIYPSDHGAPGSPDLFGTAVDLSDDGAVLVAIAPGADGFRGKAYAYSGAGHSTETLLYTGTTPTTDEPRAIAVSGDGSTIAFIVNNKVHVRTGADWADETILTVSGGDAVCLDLSDDGTVIAVGGIDNHAYILSGVGWGTETLLAPPDDPVQFGSAIAMTPDASVVAVGDPSWPSSARGRVHVYSGVGYATVTAVVAPDGFANDYFGHSLGLSGDGSTLAVGAHGWSAGANTGRVYVFASPFAGDPLVGVTSDHVPNDKATFGGVSLSDDGSVLVIGVPSWSGDVEDGAAYVGVDLAPLPPLPPPPPPPAAPSPSRRVESGRKAAATDLPMPARHQPVHRRSDNGLRVVMAPISGITPPGIFPHGGAFHFQCAPINQFGESGAFNWQDYGTVSAGQHSQRVGRQLRTIQMDTIFLDWDPSWAIAAGGASYPAQEAKDLLCKIRDSGYPFRLTVTNPLRDKAEVDYAAKLAQVDWNMQAGEIDAYYITVQFSEFSTPDILEFLTGHHPHLPVTLVVAKLPQDRNTLLKLAKFYYGDPSKARHIASFNKITGIPFSEILTAKNTHKKKITVPVLAKAKK